MGYKSDIEIAQETPMPVSYTHLDVYKRQDVDEMELGSKNSIAYIVEVAEMCIRDSGGSR